MATRQVFAKTETSKTIQIRSTLPKDITGDRPAVETSSSEVKRRNKNERPGRSSSRTTSVVDDPSGSDTRLADLNKCGQSKDETEIDIDHGTGDGPTVETRSSEFEQRNKSKGHDRSSSKATSVVDVPSRSDTRLADPNTRGQGQEDTETKVIDQETSSHGVADGLTSSKENKLGRLSECEKVVGETDQVETDQDPSTNNRPSTDLNPQMAALSLTDTACMSSLNTRSSPGRDFTF